MAKRKRLTGRERREARRRQRERVRNMPRDVALVLTVIAIPVVIALVLILFVIDGGDGEEQPVVVGSPTVTDATPPSSTPLPITPAPDSPPPLDIEPETTASGLGIITVEEGEGEGALPGQTLTVNYTGWLTADGTKFDSSVDRGEPFEFILGRGNVIAGWDEGLTGAKVGTKLRLLIPSALAYGDQGQGSIPPNSDLTFDVEVLEISSTDDSGG